ncbi:hypothetical protein FCOIX_8986 [Fusarium coicis]|nr:hypothetical protein FCOIX_8986 [Fusarium coicis]
MPCCATCCTAAGPLPDRSIGTQLPSPTLPKNNFPLDPFNVFLSILTQHPTHSPSLIKLISTLSLPQYIKSLEEAIAISFRYPALFSSNPYIPDVFFLPPRVPCLYLSSDHIQSQSSYSPSLGILLVSQNLTWFAEDNQPFTRLFGHCRMSQWLPIAIKFNEQICSEPFLLRTVKGINEPELISQSQGDNDVWVVLTSGPSPSGPRALPAQVVERIKELATIIDPDITMGRNDIAATDSSNSGEDESINVIMATTRAEALQSAAGVLGKLGQPGVPQWDLKPEFDIWLNYSPSWCELVRSCLDDDREIWILEREVPTASNLCIPKGGGSNFLRLYSRLAKEAFELKSSNPVEARRLMDRVYNNIRLFAANENKVRVRGPGDDVVWKADIAELWSLHAQRTGKVPDCLRRIALANCTPEEVQELEATLGSNSEDLLL